MTETEFPGLWLDTSMESPDSAGAAPNWKLGVAVEGLGAVASNAGVAAAWQIVVLVLSAEMSIKNERCEIFVKSNNL